MSFISSVQKFFNSIFTNQSPPISFKEATKIVANHNCEFSLQFELTDSKRGLLLMLNGKILKIFSKEGVTRKDLIYYLEHYTFGHRVVVDRLIQ